MLVHTVSKTGDEPRGPHMNCTYNLTTRLRASLGLVHCKSEHVRIIGTPKQSHMDTIRAGHPSLPPAESCQHLCMINI